VAEVSLPRSRREIVLDLARAAGVAPAIIGLLEGTASALPRGESADLAILSAAVALENQAIAIYDHGTRRSLIPAGLRHYAVEFRGDHLGHRDTQVAILEERGGKAPEALPESLVGSVAAGDDWIRQALTIEIAAQDAYGALISQIRTKDYLLSAAFILVDEIRHMTVWRRVLGLKIY
jgi:hypothetical protein